MAVPDVIVSTSTREEDKLDVLSFSGSTISNLSANVRSNSASSSRCPSAFSNPQSDVLSTISRSFSPLVENFLSKVAPSDTFSVSPEDDLSAATFPSASFMDALQLDMMTSSEGISKLGLMLAILIFSLVAALVIIMIFYV